MHLPDHALPLLRAILEGHQVVTQPGAPPAGLLGDYLEDHGHHEAAAVLHSGDTGGYELKQGMRLPGLTAPLPSARTLHIWHKEHPLHRPYAIVSDFPDFLGRTLARSQHVTLSHPRMLDDLPIDDPRPHVEPLTLLHFTNAVAAAHARLKQHDPSSDTF